MSVISTLRHFKQYVLCIRNFVIYLKESLNNMYIYTQNINFKPFSICMSFRVLKSSFASRESTHLSTSNGVCLSVCPYKAAWRQEARERSFVSSLWPWSFVHCPRTDQRGEGTVGTCNAKALQPIWIPNRANSLRRGWWRSTWTSGGSRMHKC